MDYSFDIGSNALAFGLVYLVLKFLVPVIIGAALIIAGVVGLKYLLTRWNIEVNENFLYAIAFTALILILLYA
ncbi:MAG: hypothetical protein H7831_15775 [Magnetococcus sp. WYHC-3]